MRILLVLLLTINIAQASILDLKITEIMYNPPVWGPFLSGDLEFIEIKNTGSTSIDLSGVSFIQGIFYTFTNGTLLAAGEFIVLASNTVAFNNKYSTVTPHGQYLGGLRNAGERIRVSNSTDTIISIRYNDNLPWPSLADGHGWSLVPIDVNPVGDQDDSEFWRASSNRDGSAGADDPNPTIFPEIMINEVLSHAGVGSLDLIELYNASASPVDVGGWFISDTRDVANKFRIPDGTSIAVNDYLQFDESDFNVGGTPFVLSKAGEEVILFSADSGGSLTGYSYGWEFGAQYPGVAFGTYMNSENETHFVAMENQTFGSV
ncbi:MAG: lamin tail domain-containing protein, partial [Bacteroidetes bacterium]|nr:lamin tail domain-containing protein [Bacteroidota bacterium]